MEKFELLAAASISSQVFWDMLFVENVFLRISKDRSAFVFRIKKPKHLEGEGTTFFRKSGNRLSVDATSHPSSSKSSNDGITSKL
jgi:hypothetical protein